MLVGNHYWVSSEKVYPPLSGPHHRFPCSVLDFIADFPAKPPVPAI